MTTLTTAEGPGLLDPLKVGSLQLPNRVIMAPLTRCRASEGRVPNLLMAEYYRQRSSAGLIISEATAVTPMGVGYPDTPGIWSDEQLEGWQLVTEAVIGRRTNLATTVARRENFGPGLSAREIAGCSQRDCP